MPNHGSDPSFFERLGAEQGCRKLAATFYAGVARSEILRPLFPGKSLRCATEEFAAFLIQFFEGDEEQTQYRWWLSLRESHARFKISEEQRREWLAIMARSLESSVQNEEDRDALQNFFAATSRRIVGGTGGPIESAELSHRWSQHEKIECLMKAIVSGEDQEAIKLAQTLTNRRSAFVGIAARMIETGRDDLVRFILQSIRADHDLLDARFNGRTLLHFAAGTACLVVVEELLGAGTDADVLDCGKHTPLYRVASTGCNSQGALVVAALVQAGANVNHNGGVSRSTPLHQAARFGNVAIARALLDAGADPSMTDKRGLTALDRAVNCRRLQVAALLRSI